MYHTKRNGLSLVECLILTIVLLVAIGAIFTVMWSSQRNYVHHKQAREAREVMFRWFQTFESQWPPADDFFQNTADWNAPVGNPNSAITAMLNVSNLLGGPGAWVGTFPGGGANNFRTQLGIFTVDVQLPPALDPLSGRIDLTIVISEGGGARRVILDQVRSYNFFSVDRVAEDIFRQI